MKKARNTLAGVSKSLNGDADFGGILVVSSLEFLDAIVGAPTGRLVPPETAAKRNRFAGDYSRAKFPLDSGLLVHHPSHDDWIGVNIRSGNIPIWSDEIRHLLDEGTAHSNEMPALAPPKGISSNAHLQVIQKASAFTSSMLTLG